MQKQATPQHAAPQHVAIPQKDVHASKASTSHASAFPESTLATTDVQDSQALAVVPDTQMDVEEQQPSLENGTPPPTQPRIIASTENQEYFPDNQLGLYPDSPGFTPSPSKPAEAAISPTVSLGPTWDERYTRELQPDGSYLKKLKPGCEPPTPASSQSSTPTPTAPPAPSSPPKPAAPPSTPPAPAPELTAAEPPVIAPTLASVPTPSASVPDHVPESLVQSMAQLKISTPAKQPTQKQAHDDSIKFGPVTPDAVKAWTAILRRQSTDSIPEVASPAAPSSAPAVTLQLMKMDDRELAAKLASVRASPLFQVFLQGVDESMLMGDPLKILLAYELWQQLDPPPKEVLEHNAQDKAAETTAAAAMAKTTATSTPSQPATAPAASSGGPSTPAAPAALEATHGANSTPAPVDGCMENENEDPMAVDAQKKEAKATYMRYYRAVRSPKCPDVIAVKFREACQDTTGQLAAQLFASYIESGENWLSSSIYLSETQSHDQTEGGRWAWLTKADARLLFMGMSQNMKTPRLSTFQSL